MNLRQRRAQKKMRFLKNWINAIYNNLSVNINFLLLFSNHNHSIIRLSWIKRGTNSPPQTYPTLDKSNFNIDYKSTYYRPSLRIVIITTSVKPELIVHVSIVTLLSPQLLNLWIWRKCILFSLRKTNFLFYYMYFNTTTHAFGFRLYASVRLIIAVHCHSSASVDLSQRTSKWRS